MARAKKDGKYVNFYMDSSLLERLEAFCEKTGLTKTKAIEKATSFWLDNEENGNSNYMDIWHGKIITSIENE